MNFLVGLFTELAGVVGGMLNGVLGNTVAIMKSGIGTAKAFHQEGISLARDLGMGLNQANAYTKVLAERTMDLASKYGVAKEAIIAVQRNLSETTGKQLMLNDAQAESFVQANKLIGEGTTNEFIDNIMNGMGGQVSAVEKAISKAYATASKQGLNAKKFSKTVADNLSMANRLNFRNGVDGIAKMAAMSEKLGLNLKDVETAANKFMDLDSAIESSAHLQMLGGSIGASFGNPLTNAYESMYDPEAFAERMENAIKGMASFDESKGYATVSPINQEILANYANEMGLNKEDVIKNAKKQAEVNYKEQRFGGKLNSLGLSEEQKNFLINNGQIKNGELYYTDAKGGEHNVSRNDVNGDLINEMMQFSNMSDSDLMRSQAASLTSIEEALKGNADATGAAFARGLGLEERAKGIKDVINEVGKTTKDIAGHLGGAVGKAMDGISNFIMAHKDTFKKIAESITKMFSFLTEHWKLLLAAIVGLKAAKFLGNIPGGRKLGAKAAKGAWRGIKNGAKGAWRGIKSGAKSVWNGTKGARSKIKSGAKGAWRGIKSGAKSVWNGTKSGAKSVWNGTKSGAKSVWSGTKSGAKAAWRGAKGAWSGIKSGTKTVVKKGYDILGKGGANHSWKQAKNYARNAYKMTNGNTLRKSLSGAKSLWKNSKALRASVKGGAAILGVAGNIATDYLVDKGKIKKGSGVHYGAKMASTAAEYGAMGATIGSVIPGLGTAVGGGIGAAVGAIKGAYDTWKSLPENADKDFIDYAKSVGNSIVESGKEMFSGVKEKMGSALSSVNKEVQERGGYLKVAFNFITTPIRLFIDTLEGIGKFIAHPVDTIKNIWNKLTSWFSGDNVLGKLFNKAVDAVIGGKHANGGIVGGNSYSGDNVLARVNSGEMVLNRTQQSNLFSLIQNIPSILTSVLTNSNDVKAKPVGGKEYIYVPSNGNGGLNGVSEITVKDINLNINGTLKLDAGSLTNTLDIRQLLSDTSFISQMKELIKESINNDINNGRFMNDMASMRGMPSQVGLWGLK